MMFVKRLMATSLAMVFTTAVHAAVSPEQVARLGSSLTLVGAEKAGSADGSIPAYSGGLTTAPASFKAGDTFRPDPFASEKPVLVIDATGFDVRARGVEIPIVAGIMPISNFSQVRRFSEMCGAEIPRWIAQRMVAFGDDADSVRAFGAEVVAQLCQRLIDGGAPGLHFYTLNLAKPTQNVLARLRA